MYIQRIDHSVYTLLTNTYEKKEGSAMKSLIAKKNLSLTIFFSILSLLFIIIMAVQPDFFNWTFARHQNILSWYIRPLFLIPFCFFAYRHNPAGIALTLLLLLTSMFWFPVPVSVNEQVTEFLQMEKDYLTLGWSASKILLTLLVPLSLSFLAIALWKRSIKFAILIIALIAAAKILWSVVAGGESGESVIIPAIIGLLICIVAVYFGYRILEKK